VTTTAQKHIETLRKLLRPPGRGIPTFSTGDRYAAPILESLYGTDILPDAREAWSASLAQIPDATTILLGIPSDTGAGLVRCAAYGPLGIRVAWQSRYGKYPKGLLDVGDVLCIPQLLHDEMYTDLQLDAVRRETYGHGGDSLPVSPLSISRLVVSTIRALNPNAKLVMLGGDHGVTWPVIEALLDRDNHADFAILQLDAHTDLSPHRLGVRHCYNTWAYHAVQLLNPHRLVQVGLRASTRTKEQWMSQHPVLQFWADEVHDHPEFVIDSVVNHFQRQAVKAVYITNDIDGTDMKFAPATGTPEPLGMTPDFVELIISRVAAAIPIIGGDIVEVAPPLSGSLDFRNEPTSLLAARYLARLLSSEPPNE
jgi:arginase family enzyme